MKKILYLLLCLFIHSFCISQQRGAQIDVSQLKSFRNNCSFTCSISYSNTPNQNDNEYLLFFQKVNGIWSLLKSRDVTGGNSYAPSSFLEIKPYDSRYNISLESDQRDIYGYVNIVLVQGKFSDLQNSLILVNQEFERIEDVLNILFKANVRPLTYQTITVTEN